MNKASILAAAEAYMASAGDPNDHAALEKIADQIQDFIGQQATMIRELQRHNSELQSQFLIACRQRDDFASKGQKNKEERERLLRAINAWRDAVTLEESASLQRFIDYGV